MRRIARLGMVCLTVVMLVLIGTQIINVSPALAATIDSLNVTCRFVSVSGKTEVNAPYVKVQVVLASNLSTVLAQQVVHTRLRAGSPYSATLDIRRAHLAEGTRVIVSVGEWNGTRYLRPATLTGADCTRDGNIPPTPYPTSTLPPVDATPTQPLPSATVTVVLATPTPTFVSVSPTPPPTPTRLPPPTLPGGGNT